MTPTVGWVGATVCSLAVVGFYNERVAVEISSRLSVRRGSLLLRLPSCSLQPLCSTAACTTAMQRGALQCGALQCGACSGLMPAVLCGMAASQCNVTPVPDPLCSDGWPGRGRKHFWSSSCTLWMHSLYPISVFLWEVNLNCIYTIINWWLVQFSTDQCMLESEISDTRGDFNDFG